MVRYLGIIEIITTPVSIIFNRMDTSALISSNFHAMGTLIKGSPASEQDHVFQTIWILAPGVQTLELRELQLQVRELRCDRQTRTDCAIETILRGIFFCYFRVSDIYLFVMKTNAQTLTDRVWYDRMLRRYSR